VCVGGVILGGGVGGGGFGAGGEGRGGSRGGGVIGCSGDSAPTNQLNRLTRVDSVSFRALSLSVRVQA